MNQEENKKQIPPTILSGQAEIKPGMIVRVHQKIKELDTKGNPTERVQIFEGIIIARRGGNQAGATFTIRKIGADGIGVEKIYPLHSPSIVNIEIVAKHKVRRAKLYYLRDYKKKMKEVK